MDRRVIKEPPRSHGRANAGRKATGSEQIKALESQRNAKRRTLFDAQDEIDGRREQLIADIEGKLQAEGFTGDAILDSMELT